MGLFLDTKFLPILKRKKYFFALQTQKNTISKILYEFTYSIERYVPIGYVQDIFQELRFNIESTTPAAANKYVKQNETGKVRK